MPGDPRLLSWPHQAFPVPTADFLLFSLLFFLPLHTLLTHQVQLFSLYYFYFHLIKCPPFHDLSGFLVSIASVLHTTLHNVNTFNVTELCTQKQLKWYLSCYAYFTTIRKNLSRVMPRHFYSNHTLDGLSRVQGSGIEYLRHLIIQQLCTWTHPNDKLCSRGQWLRVR